MICINLCYLPVTFRTCAVLLHICGLSVRAPLCGSFHARRRIARSYRCGVAGACAAVPSSTRADWKDLGIAPFSPSRLPSCAIRVWGLRREPCGLRSARFPPHSFHFWYIFWKRLSPTTGNGAFGSRPRDVLIDPLHECTGGACPPGARHAEIRISEWRKAEQPSFQPAHVALP